MADKPNLANLDATEWLTLYSDNRYYRLMGGSLIPDTPGGASAATLALDPKHKALPDMSASLTGGGGQSPTATVFLGGKLLNYEGRFEDMSQKQGGPAVTNTVSGKAGPFSAHYSEMEQPGNQGLWKTVAGANLNIGPMRFSAQRDRSKQGAVDTRTDTVGARGSVPFMDGTLSGNVKRQFVEDQDPVTNYGLGWQGPVGPGTFRAEGNLMDVRNVGRESSAKAEYIHRNPLGWGGELSATGRYVNPLDPNRESAAEAMLRYTLGRQRGN
jgi:hypothetical protein